MAKGGSGLAAPDWQARRSSVNAGASLMLSPQAAAGRVLGIQRKLHKWASDDQDRGFSDLHNLVCDSPRCWSRGGGCAGSRVMLGRDRWADRLIALNEEERSGGAGPLAIAM